MLVAGGGPAGMEAAITAAGRGHMVTLVEKAGRLGGNLHPAAAPFFKKDIEKLCQVLESRVKAAGVEVVLDTEVTADYIKVMAPDALFVAIGSNELKPPIKGMDGSNVIMAVEAELHPEKLGKKITIMGGGLVGAEAAISFAHEGRQCSIIEMKQEVALEVNSFYRGGLMPQVEKAADIYVNTKVKEIVPDGVVCETDGTVFTVEADSVVCALGFRVCLKIAFRQLCVPLCGRFGPDEGGVAGYVDRIGTKYAAKWGVQMAGMNFQTHPRAPYDKVDALCALVDEYYIVGDCSQVGMIYHAINQAYYAALRV